MIIFIENILNYKGLIKLNLNLILLTHTFKSYNFFYNFFYFKLTKIKKKIWQINFFYNFFFSFLLKKMHFKSFFKTVFFYRIWFNFLSQINFFLIKNKFNINFFFSNILIKNRLLYLTPVIKFHILKKKFLKFFFFLFFKLFSCWAYNFIFFNFKLHLFYINNNIATLFFYKSFLFKVYHI